MLAAAELCGKLYLSPPGHQARIKIGQMNPSGYGVITPWQTTAPARNVSRLKTIQTQPRRRKPLPLPTVRRTGAEAPRNAGAANFSRTPLGRVMLHLECLCHHPAAARFHFQGLMRNLREGAAAVKSSGLKSLRTTLRRKPQPE
jgi:hypothetical protein